MSNQSESRIWLSGREADFRSRLESALIRTGMIADGVPGAVLAVDEMLANIVEHGYGNRPEEIAVGVWAHRDLVRVALLDRAPDTAWYKHPIPSLADQARRMAYRGRGRALAAGLTRRMIHRRREGGGNVLLLEFSALGAPTQPRELPPMPKKAEHLVSITKITRAGEASVCCTSFRGVVRGQTVFRFREYLEQGGKRCPYLLVDLSDVGYISSTGLGVLVEQAQRQESLGGWLRLVNPSTTVKMILNVSGLTEAFAPVPTVEAGLDDLTRAA